MTDAADFAVKHLPDLLHKAEDLRSIILDSESISSLARTIDFCLVSAYWNKRNLDKEGGCASTELSDAERAEAQRLYDCALAILEGPIATPDEIAFALSIASAGQYSRFKDTFDFEADKRLSHSACLAIRCHEVSDWGLRSFVRMCRNTITSAVHPDNSDEEALTETRAVLESLEHSPFDMTNPAKSTRTSYITAYYNVFWRIKTTGREFFPVDELLDLIKKSPLLREGLQDGNQYDRVNMAMMAILACHQIAPHLCWGIWRAAASWIGEPPWDTKINADLQGDLMKNLIEATLEERHAETSCFMDVFGKLQLVFGTTTKGAQEMANLVSEFVNLQLPREPAVGLARTEALVQILLASLQTGSAGNQEKIAEALVRLWVQLAFDRHISDAFGLLSAAWGLSRQFMGLWLAQAVFRAIAVLVTFPEISQTDVRCMLSWLKEDLGQQELSIVSEARNAAIIALCECSDLGISVENFIEMPERSIMDSKAAANLDTSLTDLLAGRIAKLAGSGDFVAAFRELRQVRRLAARTPNNGALNVLDLLITVLPTEDSRRSDLVNEYQELELQIAEAASQKPMTITSTDPSLRPYRKSFTELSKLAEQKVQEMLHEPEWPFEPLYKGNWIEVPAGSQAVDFIRRARDALAGEAFFNTILAHRILAMRVAQPTFYKDVFILEILLGAREEDAGSHLNTVVLMLAPDGATYIDGNSSRIHHYNGHGRLTIDTLQQAEDYLRFFCGAVQGEEGPFTVTESVDELLRRIKPGTPPVEADKIPAIRSVVSKFIGSSQESSQEAETKVIWECDAFINYSNALFAAKLQIQVGGMIEMVEDEPLMENLPVRQPRFQDGFRGFY